VLLFALWSFGVVSPEDELAEDEPPEDISGVLSPEDELPEDMLAEDISGVLSLEAVGVVAVAEPMPPKPELP